MSEITFQIDDKRIRRTIQNLDVAVDDFTEPLTVIDKKFQFDIKRNFNARGGLYGKWRPRTRSYSHPLLEKTGTMKDSFDSAIVGDTLTIFNTADHYKYHQRGTSKLPKRLMMAIRATDAKFVVKAFQAYLIKEARKQGTR